MGLLPKDRDLAKPVERIELVVRASDLHLAIEDVHVRLDSFLAHHLHWRSRSSIQELVRGGSVMVDPAGPDQRTSGTLAVETRGGRKLRHGSRVVVVVPEDQRLPEPQTGEGDLAVLYEDEQVLAIDKPPLMTVHPSGRFLTGTLIQRVHARYRSEGAERVPIRLCHRLDRETSGIVLIALDPRAHPKLMAQFERREVEKEYLALVHGAPEQDVGTIDLPLGSARASQVMIKMAVREDGMASRTEWRVLERKRSCALVACRIHTGRQHQIRVHMASIGHPLIGDKLYGDDEGYFLREQQGKLSAEDLRALSLPRHALHAHRLVFTSPATGQRIEVVSPLARDLAQWFAAQPS